MVATVTSRVLGVWGEELAELSTIRLSAECVLPRDDHFVQTDGNVSGTRVRTTAACSLWQKGRVEQPSRKWRTKRTCSTKWRVPVVSYEVANEGLRQTDGTRGGRAPSERGGRQRRACKTLHNSGISARGLGKTRRLGSDQKNHYPGPAALIGPHVRKLLVWWTGLCAAEHLRGVAPDEGNRLGMNESRQVDELFRDDLDVGMDAGRVACFSVRKIFEKLKSLCPLRRLHVAPWEEAGETASSTRNQGRVLSTENEGSTRGIVDSTGQDSSEDAKQSWHDEGGPDSFATVVKDRNASRRRQANTFTFSRIAWKLGVCGWSGDAWEPATAYLLTGSVGTTNQRFEGEVPSTAVVNMSGISGSTSVSRVDAVQAEPSQPTLHVEAFVAGQLFTEACVVGEHQFEEVQINETHRLNLQTNPNAGSGTGGMHGQYADGSLVVHPVISEDIPGRTLVVVLAPELQQDQTVYVLIDAGSVLDSSGNTLAGLVNSDSNFAVAEEVIVAEWNRDLPSR